MTEECPDPLHGPTLLWAILLPGMSFMLFTIWQAPIVVLNSYSHALLSLCFTPSHAQLFNFLPQEINFSINYLTRAIIVFIILYVVNFKMHFFYIYYLWNQYYLIMTKTLLFDIICFSFFEGYGGSEATLDSLWDLVPEPGIEPALSWNPNHWTARDSPWLFLSVI